MTDLIARLAQIRELQGKEPLPDPSKIEGASLGPPPVREREPGPVPEPPWLDENPDDEEVLAPDSPLIPRTAQEPARQPIPAGPMPEPDLAVIVAQGRAMASYKGRSVALTEKEEKAVAKVVVQALRRSLREQDRELAGMVPRKTRKHIQISGDATEIKVVTEKVVPKRRPSRQRLDGSETP